ncbi:hypothetical protein L2E82_50231 [Cichorium intybus]|nr:hypothetical protein L2E82_50231 [Cichorium intybus]
MDHTIVAFGGKLPGLMDGTKVNAFLRRVTVGYTFEFEQLEDFDVGLSTSGSPSPATHWIFNHHLRRIESGSEIRHRLSAAKTRRSASFSYSNEAPPICFLLIDRRLHHHRLHQILCSRSSAPPLSFDLIFVEACGGFISSQIFVEACDLIFVEACGGFISSQIFVEACDLIFVEACGGFISSQIFVEACGG